MGYAFSCSAELVDLVYGMGRQKYVGKGEGCQFPFNAGHLDSERRKSKFLGP